MNKQLKTLFILISVLFHTTVLSAQTKGGVYTLVTSTDQIVSGGTYLIAAYVKTSGKEEYITNIMTTKRVDGGGFYVYKCPDIQTQDNLQYQSIDLSGCNVNTVLSDANIEDPYEYVIEIKGTSSLSFSFEDIYNQYISRNSSSLCCSMTQTQWTLYKDPTKSTNYEFTFTTKVGSTSYYLKYSSKDTFNATTSDNTRGGGTTPYINLYKKIKTTISISSAGYSTIYYGNDNVKVPTGLTAFTIAQEGTTLKKGTIYNAGDVIPKGTAVVVQGAKGDYLADFVESTATSPDNLLKGTDTQTSITYTSDSKKYMLSSKNGKVGFYLIGESSTVSNASHKAYLELPSTTEAKAILFSDLDESTGILSLCSDNSKAKNNTVYDIQGKRTNKNRGLFISNNKKYLKK